jgi:hypothetical protein
MKTSLAQSHEEKVECVVGGVDPVTSRKLLSSRRDKTKNRRSQVGRRYRFSGVTRNGMTVFGGQALIGGIASRRK